eukprot:11814036-Heterocapsa_arctica.AAC.1
MSFASQPANRVKVICNISIVLFSSPVPVALIKYVIIGPTPLNVFCLLYCTPVSTCVAHITICLQKILA